MRLSFSVHGEEIVSTIEEGTLSYKRTMAFQPDAVRDCSREVVGVLERGNRAHTLSDNNLSDLHDVGERLCALLVPDEIKSRLSRGDRSMYLMVDELLVPVPWELLHDGETFWCRHFDMGRAVTTPQEIVGQAAPLPTVGPLRMLVICANPRGDLPQVETEGEKLVERLDATTTIDVRLLVDPSVDAVKRALKEHDIVHFAGHADHDPDQPEQSGWHLADGKLTAAEVVSISKGGRRMPMLVFSNACRSSHTAAWRGAHHPEQVYGLANAFLLGGVRLYLGTQWEIVDGQSSDFATAFYEAMSRGASAGTAVRVARNQVVREASQSALAWASYVLYGDPALAPVRPVESERTQPPMPSASLLEARVSAPWKRPPAHYTSKRPGSLAAIKAADPQSPAAAAAKVGKVATVPVETAATAATATAAASAGRGDDSEVAAAAAAATSSAALDTSATRATAMPQSRLVMALSVAVALIAVGAAVGIYLALSDRLSTKGGTARAAGSGSAVITPGTAVSIGTGAHKTLGHLEHAPGSDPIPLIALFVGDKHGTLESCLRSAISKLGRFRLVERSRITALASLERLDLDKPLERAKGVQMARGLRADLALRIGGRGDKIVVDDALTGDASFEHSLGKTSLAFCGQVGAELTRIIHGEGRVVGVEGERVTVNLGWRSRVAPGADLEVRRDGKIVGALKVEKVEMDRSVARGKAKVGDIVRVPRK
ncbi:MAG: CHAT domain-containing protein [Myxococcales bacterium]|nr:CHAT domain-containing protein [Myxococcales bacterium]